MILVIFVKVPLILFIQYMTENNFPYVLENLTGFKTINETTDWLATQSSSLKDELATNGALLFRGFPIKNAEDFDKFSLVFNYGNFTYEESLSNAVRINKTPRVFTANEAPPEMEIFLHHEMAQTPIYPEKIFFCCLSAAEEGGATPICPSDKVYEALKKDHPVWLKKLTALGLKYSTLMPDKNELNSGQGRGWRSTLSVTNREEAERKLKRLGYTWEWQEDYSLLSTSPILPAVTELPDGRKSFFNQVIAAHKGWKTKAGSSTPVVTFGNGEHINEDLLNSIVEIAENLTRSLEWQTGDVLLVDNKSVMHGRYPFGGSKKREVVVCLAI